MTFHNGSKQPLMIDHIKLEVPAGMEHDQRKDEAGDGQAGRRSAREFPSARAEGYAVHAALLASRRSRD